VRSGKRELVALDVVEESEQTPACAAFATYGLWTRAWSLDSLCPRLVLELDADAFNVIPMSFGAFARTFFWRHLS
jgi:hypothetical protein